MLYGTIKARSRFSLLLALCALWMAPQPRLTMAQVNAWTNTGSGFWHVAGNWSRNQLPAFTNSLVALSNFNSKVVTVDASTPPTNLVLKTLLIRAFQNRTNTLILTNLAGRMEIYNGLTLDSGAQLLAYNSQMLVDGDNNGDLVMTSAGAVLDGSGLLLTNGAVMKIGNQTGTASVAVTNSTVQVADGSLLVGAIDHSNGRLFLDGGLVEVGNELTVGDVSSSTGLVVVANGILSAANTNFNARLGEFGRATLIVSNGMVNFDDTSVGRQGTGVGLLIQGGGTMNIGTLSIGRFSNAVGTVVLGGGLLNVSSGSLYVGREGIGTLTNFAGTIAASRLVVGGETNGARGTAWFVGGDSRFRSGLQIGSGVSTGNVFVTGGALLLTNASSMSTSAIVRGTFVMSGGEVEFDRLLLTNSTGTAQLNAGSIGVRDLVVNNGAPLVVGDGANAATLYLRGGNFSFANGLIISPKATLAGCGTISGAITVQPGGTNKFQAICGNPPSPIVLTNLARLSGGIRFSFKSDFGTNYTVEFKNNFQQTNWQILGVMTGAGTIENITNAPVPSLSRFYRVRSP